MAARIARKAREDLISENWDGARRHLKDLEIVKALLDSPSHGTAGQTRALGIAIAVTVLLIAALFHSVRRPRVEFGLDIAATSITVGPDSANWDHHVSQYLSTRALTVGGVCGIDLPIGAGIEPRRKLSGPAGQLQFMSSTNAEVERGIGIPALRLIEQGVLGLSIERESRSCRMSLEGLEGDLALSLNGRVTVHSPGGDPISLNLDAPTMVNLSPCSHYVTIDLKVDSEGEQLLTPELMVDELSFDRIFEISDLDRAEHRPTSSIIEGAIYVDSLNGKRVALTRGELLTLDAARGTVLACELHDDQIRLVFKGSAKRIEVGTLENPRNLVPSWLEWLWARHGLALVWGATASALSVLGLFGKIWREGKV